MKKKKNNNNNMVFCIETPCGFEGVRGRYSLSLQS
jgi:hypothetical protein